MERTATRRFGLVQSTALNMTNMIGIGPFITIPLLMSAMGGPQAMLGWLVALAIAICDGMVWAELGAAMPGAGGSFIYLREAYGRESFGRLMAFLFVWQFIWSGPLEIASGYIGFAKYAGYIWSGLTANGTFLIAAFAGAINVILLYRRITSIAKITVSLWIGTLVTVLAVIVTGAVHFDRRIAFSFPPDSFHFSLGFLLGLGTASRIGVYDYLGYYDICYIADEVSEPDRVIPRSILISTFSVAAIYLAINLSIAGVVPWREFVPANARPQSDFVVSIFMEKIYGSGPATLFTVMILWTAFASVFALLLGYSRIPYAAAESGYFFKVFGRLHPSGGFPHVSILALGILSILACFLSLGVVIDTLIVMRILVQFIGQIFGVALLRKRLPAAKLPFRMWLYPVPTIIALFGWIFIFITSDLRVILFALGALAMGIACWALWSWRLAKWPFGAAVLLLLVSMNATAEPSKVMLRNGWQLRSSTSDRWYPTSVPSTVMAALVANKVYPDPYFGMNLRAIPGTSYPIGRNFAALPMSDESPFRHSWRFRTEFRLPPGSRNSHVALHFDGINYRANIWLNGHQIANSERVAGTFRLFEFDVSEIVRRSAANTLEVEVFPPDVDDLAITWVDWNPAPPDKNMGIWRDVYITTTGDIALRNTFVGTRLDSALTQADLSISTEVHNLADHAIEGTVRGRIESMDFSQRVSLGPKETRTVRFSPHVANPRLWWPAEMGTPNLYELSIEFDDGKGISDRQTAQFGIREITSEFNEQGGRLFRINRRPILIRGGGWAPDMLLRVMPDRQETEIRYVRDMNLNTIRMEGKLEDDHFFELADRYGILILAGWCCCDHWEQWPKWKPENYEIAAASQRDQIRRLRNHPSVLTWLNGSDNPPPPDVERTYIEILKENEWPNPYISSATAKPTPAGPSGVKMTGPYDWVPPSYWLLDKTRGGAHGFNTETSPGAAIPEVDSLRTMLPADHLWPIDDYWNYHSGGGQFRTVQRFVDALTARYGAPSGLDDFVAKSQLMAYEGERAMFEAYTRNRYASTGVIQWMLNNAWPGIIWHLYDYYLRPSAGYFATKKACEPLHVQYSYDDQSIVAINGTAAAMERVKVSARIFSMSLRETFSREVTLDLPPDSSTRVFVLPDQQGPAAYFVDLRLSRANAELLSTNFYWLAPQMDDPDWDKSTYFITPVKTFADFTDLQKVGAASVTSSVRFERKGDDESATVMLTNSGKTLAFFVRLKLMKGGSRAEILPILWQDNYLTVLPGETRQVQATYKLKDRGSSRPVLVVNGWNVH